jgi:hypothetical protein
MSAPLSQSGDAPRREQVVKRLVGIIVAILVIRLGFASALPLTEDEAYYRLWAQSPALGYFDHPPMIAWWIWIGRSLAGDSPMGVRLLPCLGAAVTSLLVFDLTRNLGASGETSLRAVIWYNATLLVAAGGALAIPDAPAALFWLACLCCLARTKAGSGGAWWMAAGVAAGLAALSKYSALFLGPGIFLWLIGNNDGRKSLRGPWPWLALIAALTLFGLNIGWNATHQWVTFLKQFGRITPHRFAPINLADLFVTQSLLLNPLITIFLIRGLSVQRKTIWWISKLLILSSLPFAAYLIVHALHDRVQAHWPAPIYGSLASIAAFAGEGRLNGAWNRLRRITPALGLGLCALAAAVLALPEIGVPLPIDPAKQIRDWPGFSVDVEQLRAAHGANWIGVTSYGLAAELLDQPAIHAPVLQITERARWRGLKPSQADLARRGVIIDLKRRIDLKLLSRCFRDVQVVGDIRRAARGEPGLDYRAIQVEGPLRDVVRDGC